MKTFKDLLDLILSEETLNEHKAQRITFDIDTNHKWISMYKYIEYFDDEQDCMTEAKDVVFSYLSFKTQTELQEVYWRIWNAGRTKNYQNN